MAPRAAARSTRCAVNSGKPLLAELNAFSVFVFIYSVRNKTENIALLQIELGGLCKLRLVHISQWKRRCRVPVEVIAGGVIVHDRPLPARVKPDRVFFGIQQAEEAGNETIVRHAPP